MSSVIQTSHFFHNFFIFSGDEKITLSAIIPFLDKKNKVAGFALPFSLNPTKVILTSLFSKINELSSVAA